jgi:glycerate dehydrogenase
MKIVFLDAYTTNHGEMDFSGLEALGTLEVYDRTRPEQVLERAGNAEVVISNKVVLDRRLMARLPKLRLVCVAATGYNNIDVRAAAELGITVCNVVGYSTNSVAQQVFALLLALVNQTARYSREVHEGKWSRCPDFSYWHEPIRELHGLTFGIYGLGKIGQATAKIALAFGMRVIALHKHPERDKMEGVRFVDWEELLGASDIISLHAPLTAENKGLFNRDAFRRMKSGAWLINTSRGPVIDEQDLADALREGEIAGAGLDVLCDEPPPVSNPLLGAPRCIITPHHAWATQQARERLIQGLEDNIRAFVAGRPENVVSR